MNQENQTQTNQPPTSPNTNNQEAPREEILCHHCLRTATNGIKCKGICVADSDY
ncbi:hypothetical protein [Calothrix sp. NIES-3974]|uniref:hypothetical protein n=1 Tax=Calothrix sp. NIES-3974 TaxID=2005462 RepID=UPI000B618089|nr:hypothetical protein [Calothrix sp. NIES-3974]BAZ03891.1 hypothetical protein NIES3974_05210 [Calothrix sp. NIES-3974]